MNFQLAFSYEDQAEAIVESNEATHTHFGHFAEDIVVGETKRRKHHKLCARATIPIHGKFYAVIIMPQRRFLFSCGCLVTFPEDIVVQ
jgi:hypothetical protein